MSTPDPRRDHDPTMHGDDDLQAGHYGPGADQGTDPGTDDASPADDPTVPQPDDEQPPTGS